MAQGIILAAGYSSRTTANKMLLDLEEKPLIMYAIEGMRPFVTHIFVVTGHYHHETYETLRDIEGVTCVFNKGYDEGMFSSVQLGVNATSEDFFILPGDCPFVHPSTYELLLKGSLETRVPNYKGRNGHPLFIKNKLRNVLLNEPKNSNLKAFRNKCELEIIKVNDNHVLTDIDTIEEFEKLKRKESRNGY